MPEALHVYCDAAGTPVYWRWRVRQSAGEKVIRPMRYDGAAFVLGEPPAPITGKLLYRLPELLASDPAQTVLVVEGEWCADHLASLGLTVTTSGSASSAQAADWSPLAGRACLVWPDHDAAGQGYATAVIAKLRMLDCPVNRIDVAALGLPDTGDAVDWLALHPHATADTVLALPRCAESQESQKSQAASTDGRWGSAPEPLRRPLAPASAYPLAALGSLLGNAAQRVHDVVQAPAALCGASILSAASLAVQAHADVAISGCREPLSLWHVTIGASGERKSAVDHLATRAHRDVERGRAEQWTQAKAGYTIEAAAYDAAARKAGKGRDAAAIRDALHALGAAPDAPLLPWLMLSEPTMEGLHKAYQFGQPSLGLFNDDAGDFLGGHAMSKDHRAKSAASFSKLWDDGQFNRVRAGDGASKYYGRRLAMHLMVQPVLAETLLGDDLLVGQGFLPRCLLAWPASTIGTRTYQDVDLSQDVDLARYWRRMTDLLRTPFPLQANTRNELAPRALMLAPAAMALWIEIKNALEAAMRGSYAPIPAWASKGGSQVARMAGVLTLTEDPEAEVIPDEAIERAAQLVTYHLDEAARIVGTASVPAVIRHAESLLAWCHAHGITQLYSTQALNTGPSVIRTRDAFMEAMVQLEAAGWAQRLDRGAHLDGKHRKKAWCIVPPEAA